MVSAVMSCTHEPPEGPCLNGIRPGVLLSFDDYSDSWISALPLLKKYDVRTTFFVSGEGMRDTARAADKLRPLLKAGHSLGVHTFSHRRAPDAVRADGLRWLTHDVLDQRDAFVTLGGRPVIAFAYPQGRRNRTTDALLAPNFHFIRGFSQQVVFMSERRMRLGGRVRSTSIDNIRALGDDWYEDQLRDLAGQECQVWLVTSHAIGEHNWGITAARLARFLSLVKKFKLAFYRFEDFVQPSASVARDAAVTHERSLLTHRL